MDLESFKDQAESLKDQAEDIVDKAKDAISSVVNDEEKTDATLDAVSGAAKKATGDRFDEKIDAARDALDDKIGE